LGFRLFGQSQKHCSTQRCFHFAKRAEILKDAFAVDATKTKGKSLLLMDDLYRSGATVSAIAKLLTTAGGAHVVYLLTLTQTRKLA
jgi:predicted amidophosphoribosyltransferase